MNGRKMTLEQIRANGLDALAKKLGPVGMARFLQQFETGKGDYSKVRQRLFKGLDVEALSKKIRRRANKA